jgi:hypothetical protein
VAAHIALLQASGVRNLMLTNRGLLTRVQTQASLRLLSEQVIPQFRADEGMKSSKITVPICNMTREGNV